MYLVYIFVNPTPGRPASCRFRRASKCIREVNEPFGATDVSSEVGSVKELAVDALG